MFQNFLGYFSTDLAIDLGTFAQKELNNIIISRLDSQM